MIGRYFIYYDKINDYSYKKVVESSKKNYDDDDDAMLCWLAKLFVTQYVKDNFGWK